MVTRSGGVLKLRQSISVHFQSNQCILWSCNISNIFLFTVLHEMQTRSSDENSVCLSVLSSVRLSVARVIPDKMEERSVQIFIPYERTFSLVF